MYKDLDAAVQDKQDIVIHLANENANHRKVKKEKIHSLAWTSRKRQWDWKVFDKHIIFSLLLI